MNRPHTNPRRRATTAAALTALLALAVGACGSDDAAGSASSSALRASADTTTLATPATPATPVTEAPPPVTQPPVIESTPPTEPVGVDDRAGPVVTHLATIGADDFVTGSTSGPGGALYVTDGSNGEVLRIDLPDGAVSTVATGLPQKAFQGQDIGGPVDVAFIGQTAYVLVTLVSGEIFGGPFGDPSVKNGLYRIERDGTHTLVADIGQWSIDNPPEPAYFVDTGVQFSMEPYRGGFLVTDGHHNRVLWVDQDGSIQEFAAFGNVVPTGLETTDGSVFVTQMGHIPHEPEDGKVVEVRPGGEPFEVASGASMLIDVEKGPRGLLYGVSQGQWDGVSEGSRAEPNTGRLVVAGRDGELTPVADDSGKELVLDRPTSLEFDGNTAYVLSVTGDVYRVDGL